MAELRLALADALGPLYRVEREVRPVGDCRLFVARPIQTGPDLLVKVLPRAVSLAVDATRFGREVTLLADRLRHPQLVAPRGAGRAGPFVYHSRPFVEGTTLAAWLMNNGATPLARGVELLYAVLSGLAHAHAAEIAHGDLRSENVLLGDGEILLADVGVAGAVGRSLTASSGGGAAPSPRDDMVALGRLVHEMLTGRPAGAREEPLEQSRALPHWLAEWLRTPWTDAGQGLAAMTPPPAPPAPPDARRPPPQPFA